MKNTTLFRGFALALIVALTACSSEPSLTAEELARHHPEKKYIEIDGVSLHYEQQGLGRPLVLLHGFSTSSHIWRNITPGLTYGTTVYTLDLMGFGYSEKPQDRSYSIETYVTQLEVFLERLNLEKPILGGQGIGALIATLYTLRHPDEVRKLILVGAPLYDARPSFNRRLLSFPMVGSLLTGDWFLKRLWRSGVEDQERMSDLALKPYLAPYQSDPGARATLRKLLQEFDAQSVLEKEIRPNLSQIDVPTLLIWGPHDAEVPLEVGRRLDREISNSDITVVLGSGHYVQEERPAQVRAAIKEFAHS